MAFSSWRGVVGMINPTLRPGVTEEVIRLLPEGIGLIPLFLNIRRGTEDEFAAMMPAYEELVAVLAECGCDLIHPHGAPPFMVQGRKREAEIVRAWEKKYKTPIMSVAQNHVNVLKTLKAKTILGSAWRTLDIIETLEQDLQVPVVHPVTARVWEIQKRLHVREPRSGFGHLLAALP